MASRFACYDNADSQVMPMPPCNWMHCSTSRQPMCPTLCSEADKAFSREVRSPLLPAGDSSRCMDSRGRITLAS